MALKHAVCHLYNLVAEGDRGLWLCAGGAATELMPFVLKNLTERSGAAVFDVGPPIARAMEALRGWRSAEGSVIPGLEEARPEAPRHQANSLPTALPSPFIAGEYPKYKYQKGRKTIVKDAEEEAALGEAWQDLPV